MNRFKFDQPTITKDGTDGVLTEISVLPQSTKPTQQRMAFRAQEYTADGEASDSGERFCYVTNEEEELGDQIQVHIDAIAVLIKSKFKPDA